MKIRFYVLLLSFISITNAYEIEIPNVVLQSIPFEINLADTTSLGHSIVSIFADDLKIAELSSQKLSSKIVLKNQKKIYSISNEEKISLEIPRLIPGWLSLVPPIVAIALALLTHEMLLSLFAGVWAGVTILLNYNPWDGMLSALDTYIVSSIANDGHAIILLFTFGFGGLIGLIQNNGGIGGIVEKASAFAVNRNKGQYATAFMGLVIFFDDYANSLLVGNTMRPITDKLKISREKLSYIVDSTAAPVASIGIISTWIVFAVSLLEGQLNSLNISGNAYFIFLGSIPFSFYAIFAIVFVFLTIYLGKEYGPMWTAEVRATKTGKVFRDGAQLLSDNSVEMAVLNNNVPKKSINALIPILVVISFTMIGMLVTGSSETSFPELSGIDRLLAIMNGADSAKALLWASFSATLVAIIMTISQRLLSLRESLESWFQGARTMFLASMILVLAWALGSVCIEMNTASYIVHNIGDVVSGGWLPLLTFIMASLMSFATGTSYGTMSILIPLVVPLSIQLYGGIDGVAFSATFAAIISGATFGDHCSPISDTTILSSLASGADNVDHVNSQLPYALTVSLVIMILAYFPMGFSGSASWGLLAFSYVACLTALWAIINYYGKKVV
jgi:Na+/H+ antiporter NhaC